jgi:DNA replication and repair protein RecF
MKLNHLALSNYRSYARLECEFPSGILILSGGNAQGKTSLIESVFYCAAFSSALSQHDSQLINFHSLDEPLAVARIKASYERDDTSYLLETRIIRDASLPGAPTRKEILLDGQKISVQKGIGKFPAVLFIPQMTAIIDGAPQERRRYLNIFLSQSVPGYAKSLTRYKRILTQRNALLKMIAERSSNNAQLPYWDELLVEQGAFQLLHRAQALTFLNERAASVHTRLTNNSELLSIHYQPALSADTTADDWEIFSASTLPDLEAIKAMMRKNLQIAKPREIARGVTLIGPHRDEFRIAANGIDLNLYGSRGQVRTALLSLKFAETDWMERTMGTMPIILLDETLAELDEQRRSDLQSWLNQIPQGILTTTDLTHFHPDFIATHTVRTVENGLIREISELKRADEL